MTKSGKSKRSAPTEQERAGKRAAERDQMRAAIAALRGSDGWKRWLGVRRHFHTYSLHNQLLIALQCPEATRVAGFRAWLGLGYAVRKGERSIRIWAPCPPSKKQLAAWRKAGASPEDKPSIRFRMVSVFDRSQVDPIPGFPGDPSDLEPPHESIEGDGLAHLFVPLADFGGSLGLSIAVEPVSGSASGFHQPEIARVVVDVAGPNFSPNAQLATLIHELAHALVRLDRRDEDPTLTYAEEEVVVESVAYIVCSTLGLDSSGSSIPYMASWSEGGGEEAIELYAKLIDRLARRLERPLLEVDLEIRPADNLVA